MVGAVTTGRRAQKKTKPNRLPNFFLLLLDCFSCAVSTETFHRKKSSRGSLPPRPAFREMLPVDTLPFTAVQEGRCCGNFQHYFQRCPLRHFAFRKTRALIPATRVAIHQRCCCCCFCSSYRHDNASPGIPISARAFIRGVA